MADGSYQPKTYRKQGGDEFVIASGGVATVESGGAIAIETGGDITHNGVSLIDEIAALSGLDSGELGVLNAVTAGTVAASKVLVADANKAIRFGNWVASGALGSAIVLSASLDHYSDGQVDVLGIYGESAANLTSAKSAKVARFRHLVNCTTAAHETYGAVGQVVAKDTTLTHLHAGLMGTFEGNTSGVVLNSSYTTGGHAAVMARIGGHATITATTPLAGFLAFNNASAALAGGSSYAFAASVLSNTYPWTVGLNLPNSSVVTGVSIGTCTTGILLSGTQATGINVATTISGATNGRSMKIDGTLVAPAHADGYGTIEINANFSGTIAGPYACASSTWVNLVAAAVPGANVVAVQNNGIYAPSGITHSSATYILGARMQYVADDKAQPGQLFLFDTNIYGGAVTALFQCNALGEFTPGATKTGGEISIPLFRSKTGNQTYYVNVYTS
jgi:hypothetical protein